MNKEEAAAGITLVDELEKINDYDLLHEQIPKEIKDEYREDIIRNLEELLKTDDVQKYITYRLFTGERLKTKSALKNVLIMEMGRALLILGRDDPQVKKYINSVDKWLEDQCFYKDGCTVGECAHSYLTMLRYLSAEERDDIDRFVKTISKKRDGKGRWTKLPFYYTLSILDELGMKIAKEEIQYSIPACERVSNRYKKKKDKYGMRRNQIIQDIVGYVS